MLLQGMNISQIQSTLQSAGNMLYARSGFFPERLGLGEASTEPTGVFVPDVATGRLSPTENRPAIGGRENSFHIPKVNKTSA